MRFKSFVNSGGMKIKQQNICVDASLWVRFLTREEPSEPTSQLFREWGCHFNYFIEPSLFLFEIASVIRKKQKLRMIPADFPVVMTLHDLYQLPILIYQSEKLVRQTIRVAEALGETDAYDASYLALAKSKKVPFFTADGKFYRKAKPLYPDIHLV